METVHSEQMTDRYDYEMTKAWGGKTHPMLHLVNFLGIPISLFSTSNDLSTPTTSLSSYIIIQQLLL